MQVHEGRFEGLLAAEGAGVDDVAGGVHPVGSGLLGVVGAAAVGANGFAATAPGSARHSTAASVVLPLPNAPFSQTIMLLPWPSRPCR
ncbi:hypothetical protein ACF1DV_32385 [Streptomyces achromogenes]|uniref:hypothetical protein n=1 Tax=Streptomyces achromogenes TaxID=67255 RepID=UPI0036FDCE76